MSAGARAYFKAIEVPPKLVRLRALSPQQTPARKRKRCAGWSECQGVHRRGFAVVRNSSLGRSRLVRSVAGPHAIPVKGLGAFAALHRDILRDAATLRFAQRCSPAGKPPRSYDIQSLAHRRCCFRSSKWERPSFGKHGTDTASFGGFASRTSQESIGVSQNRSRWH